MKTEPALVRASGGDTVLTQAAARQKPAGAP
jgi:hypothetical protein